jgi:transcription elongation factor S-II
MLVDDPASFRTNIKNQLVLIFGTNTQNERHCSNIEKGIYNYALEESDKKNVVKKWDNPFFVQIYLDRLYSVYTNLKNTPELQALITKEEIKAHTVAFMTHQEMHPEKWSQLIAAKIIRDKNKYETNIEASTDSFTCRKCRSNKCTYYQMQTRSADEPMTTFVTCIDCGNRWKC